MGQNNKQYLDKAGLKHLIDEHYLVKHNSGLAKAEGMYKMSSDDFGHITLGDPIGLEDLKIENALKFVGISTRDPLSAEGALIPGVTAYAQGNVCLYRRDDELGYEEYICIPTSIGNGLVWELLGDADSYVLKSLSVTSDGVVKVNDGTSATLADGSLNFKHASFSEATPSVRAIGRDAYGHVALGGPVTVGTSDNESHGHSVTVTIPSSTVITNVGYTSSNLDVSCGQRDAIASIQRQKQKLELTDVRGITNEVNNINYASGVKNTATVAVAGQSRVIGNANVGTTYQNIAYRNDLATYVGDAKANESATTVVTGTTGSCFQAEYQAASETLVLVPATLDISTTELRGCSKSTDSIYGVKPEVAAITAAASSTDQITGVGNTTTVITELNTSQVAVPVAANAPVKVATGSLTELGEGADVLVDFVETHEGFVHTVTLTEDTTGTAGVPVVKTVTKTTNSSAVILSGNAAETTITGHSHILNVAQ